MPTTSPAASTWPSIAPSSSALPEGARQGANDQGSTGWFGMRPPLGDPAHPYHFQVFALDTRLDLPAGAGRAELLGAMEGHVLAAGEVVGTYARQAPAQ